MHLKTLKLNNFRSFDQGDIELQQDLTVFVGENNGGKSNAIDAIRLLTLPLGGRREIYCESTDVRFQSKANHFELEAHFSNLSPGQQGRLISAATDVSLLNAAFGLKFDKTRIGARPTIWAGKEGNAPEPGCHDTIRHVYLPTLRDAKRSLASGNPTRIMALLRHFLGTTSPEQFAKELGRTSSHDILAKVDGAVEKGLTALTSGVRKQAASLGFSTDEELVDIARDLRFKLADHGVAPEDLRYSGHGYANLLFLATIAVELEKVRTADLTLFLVEEPEAHLHPQLQAAVLAFLRDQAEQSRLQRAADHGLEGELQVIVATHSPNLSAWVSSDQLVVFKSANETAPANQTTKPLDPATIDHAVIETSAEISGSNDEGAEAIATVATAAALRRSTRCIPLAQMPLSAIERRKIDRYLDVTKAALLFGGRVLLVEGIAEALLLPAIAKHHVLKGHPNKLSLFRSTVFIPIDGVDFSPYVTLLLTSLNAARIADRVVVMTDGDKGLTYEEDEEEDNQTPPAPSDPASSSAPTNKIQTTDSAINGIAITPGDRRKTTLDNLAKQIGASSHFAAVTSTYSLESELVEAGNSAMMEKAYLTLHPRSQRKWQSAVKLSGDDRAKSIHEIFKEARKGDFAQILARLIEDGEHFEVPSYIKSAIEEVVAP